MSALVSGSFLSTWLCPLQGRKMQILDKEAQYSSLRRDVQAGLGMIIKELIYLKSSKELFSI